MNFSAPLGNFCRRAAGHSLSGFGERPPFFGGTDRSSLQPQPRMPRKSKGAAKPANAALYGDESPRDGMPSTPRSLGRQAKLHKLIKQLHHPGDASEAGLDPTRAVGGGEKSDTAQAGSNGGAAQTSASADPSSARGKARGSGRGTATLVVDVELHGHDGASRGASAGSRRGRSAGGDMENDGVTGNGSATSSETAEVPAQGAELPQLRISILPAVDGSDVAGAVRQHTRTSRSSQEIHHPRVPPPGIRSTTERRAHRL